MFLQNFQSVALATVLFGSSMASYSLPKPPIDTNGTPCGNFANGTFSKMPEVCIYSNFCEREILQTTSCPDREASDYYDIQKLDDMDPYCARSAICKDFENWSKDYRLNNVMAKDYRLKPQSRTEILKLYPDVVFVKYYPDDIRPLVDIQEGCSTKSSLWETSHECLYHRVCRGDEDVILFNTLPKSRDDLKEKIFSRDILSTSNTYSKNVLCKRKIKPALDLESLGNLGEVENASTDEDEC